MHCDLLQQHPFTPACPWPLVLFPSGLSIFFGLGDDMVVHKSFPEKEKNYCFTYDSLSKVTGNVHSSVEKRVPKIIHLFFGTKLLKLR